MFEPYLIYGENIFFETDKARRRFWNYFLKTKYFVTSITARLNSPTPIKNRISIPVRVVNESRFWIGLQNRAISKKDKLVNVDETIDVGRRDFTKTVGTVGLTAFLAKTFPFLFKTKKDLNAPEYHFWH